MTVGIIPAFYCRDWGNPREMSEYQVPALRFKPASSRIPVLSVTTLASITTFKLQLRRHKHMQLQLCSMEKSGESL